MHFSSPFAQAGQWFKGQLHVHSTASDGERTPEQVAGWYRRRGYHFVALTDHGVQSESQALADDFVTLTGMEVQGIDPAAGLYHLVGLGMQAPARLGGSAASSMQEAIHRLRDAGGLVVVAHPYWSGHMSRDLLSLEGCLGLEVYNGGCEVDDAKGFATVHWDDLLAAGQRLWGLAVDDAHWRDGDHDAGLGWVWVKAQGLTPGAILEALARGHFYASSGPRIHALELDGEWLRVRCSPVPSIDFVGRGHRSRRVTAPAGETLREASYRLRREQGYVRVACRDTQGCWAWSNPVFLDETGRR